MTSTWWRREGAGLRLAVRIQPLAAVRLLRGNKSRDKLLAIDGVQTLPPALAALTGLEA
jgi:multisubunit Na+/H+ antiporter MnhF subunit